MALLNQRFDKLSQICKPQLNKNMEQVLSEIKPPIFWKEKPMFLEQANKWDIKQIDKIRDDIYNAEIK